MKLYFLCDMEGVSGLYSMEHVKARDDGSGRCRYPEGRRLMTLDVGGAALAALEGGADQVVVCDTHGGGDNLLWEDLPADPRIRYETPNAGRMAPSLDETFDGLVLLGHHAKAGTPEAFLDHTMDSMSLFEVTLNGQSIGEVALEACYAGHWDVPLILAQGDEAMCREVEEQFPGVVAVGVKRAIGRNRCGGPAPEIARRLTREKLREVVASIREGKHFAPFKPDLPVTMRRTYYRTDMADACAAQNPDVRRIDGRTVERIFERACDVWRW